MNKDKLKEFLSYTNAIISSMKTSLDSSNSSDVWRFHNYSDYARKYNQVVLSLSKLIKLDDMISIYTKTPNPFDTHAQNQKEYFMSVYTNLLVLKSYLENMIVCLTFFLFIG